jgi:hypothetical protein
MMELTMMRGCSAFIVQTPSSVSQPSSIQLDEYPERTSNNQMYTYLQNRRNISPFKHFEGNTILSAVITSVVQVAKLALKPPLVIREVLDITTTV